MNELSSTQKKRNAYEVSVGVYDMQNCSLCSLWLDKNVKSSSTMSSSPVIPFLLPTIEYLVTCFPICEAGWCGGETSRILIFPNFLYARLIMASYVTNCNLRVFQSRDSNHSPTNLFRTPEHLHSRCHSCSVTLKLYFSS